MKNIVVVLLLAWACGARAEDELSIQGKSLSQWIQQLRGDNRGFQLRAARVLAEAPTNAWPRIIEQVIPVLKSPRENDKFVAAQILGEYGPLARTAVSDLLPMLEGTEYERNRAAAAKSLGQIFLNAAHDEEVEKVTQTLTRRFNDNYDTYSDVRREAVRALGMIGPAAKSCIPKLTRALTDFKLHSEEHRLVRQEAAWTCGRMGPLAAEHVDRLISMMHAEGRKAPQIVEALGCIGAIHDNVVPNIVDALEKLDGGIWWQIQAYEALEKFGTKSQPAVALLARYLRERFLHPHLAIAAIRVLKVVGPAAKEAAPSLEPYFTIKAYRSRDQNFRATTAQELEDMRRLSREAFEVMTGRKVAVSELSETRKKK